MANRPKKGDIGTVILIDMQEDISSATEHSGEAGNGLVIIVTKPDGTAGKWTDCTVQDSNYLKYTTIENDLDKASADSDDETYKLTPKFALGAWEGHCGTVEMYVYDEQETP